VHFFHVLTYFIGMSDNFVAIEPTYIICCPMVIWRGNVVDAVLGANDAIPGYGPIGATETNLYVWDVIPVENCSYI
jgi:hypothetical protein